MGKCGFCGAGRQHVAQVGEGVGRCGCEDRNVVEDSRHVSAPKTPFKSWHRIVNKALDRNTLDTRALDNRALDRKDAYRPFLFWSFSISLEFDVTWNYICAYFCLLLPLFSYFCFLLPTFTCSCLLLHCCSQRGFVRIQVAFFQAHLFQSPGALTWSRFTYRIWAEAHRATASRVKDTQHVRMHSTRRRSDDCQVPSHK